MKDASWLKRSLYLWALTVGEKLQSKASGRFNNSAVPSMARDLALSTTPREAWLRRVRFAVSGAAPISPDLIGWFHSIGIKSQKATGKPSLRG